MGSAFLHLIPEAAELSEYVFIYILIGFFAFFIIEKLFHWRHCHNLKCKEHVHSFAYMNLVGDGIHNFIDGLIVAAGFLASPLIGLTTSAAIVLHEIPQELGDFGVLVYAGFSKKKALLSNFLIALTALIGGVLGYLVLGIFENIMPLLLAVAAGGFIYIAASDLIPEIRKQESLASTLVNSIVILFGILIVYGLGILLGH